MKKATIYKYDKCNTCRKALKFLTDNEVKHISKNILETPPSLSALKKTCKSIGNIKKLLNTSSKRYRELELKNKVLQMTNEEIFDLLLKEPILIKRPLLLIDNVKGMTGFNEVIWKEELL